MKKATNESIEIARQIAGFLNEYVPLQKTNSCHTQKAYQSALQLYISFLESEKKVGQTDFGTKWFERSVIEEWLIWLRKVRICSPETCNNRLASLRIFLKYLGSRNVKYLYLYQEACQIDRRKTQKKKVTGMSRNAVKALLEVPDPGTRSGKRDLVFMILLYSTAARLDEILSLKNSQLYLEKENPYVTVIGKGNKIRTLYLLPKAVAHLKKYLLEFHEYISDLEAYVFYSRNTGTHGKMTQPAIAKMLKKYSLEAHQSCTDVPINLHAHQFRHARASHWLEDGMNIVQISFLLGHEQLQTTMVYLDITTEDSAKALATLENENDKKVTPKWKNADGSLVNFCGLSNKKK
ncbi:MAG: integrase family protein [Herbinix sp.]|jgi:site-specific recombinase XerD|nr:integrase family protein [Herbinix sp.]